MVQASRKPSVGSMGEFVLEIIGKKKRRIEEELDL